jgi:hypothetical protein
MYFRVNFSGRKKVKNQSSVRLMNRGCMENVSHSILNDGDSVMTEEKNLTW